MADLLYHYRVCSVANKQSSNDEADFTTMEPEVSLDLRPLAVANDVYQIGQQDQQSRHDALDRALKFVLDHGYSYRVAASMFGVSSSTLRRHFVLKYGEQRHVKYMHNRSVLRSHQEEQLVAEIKQMNRKIPITKDLIATYTYMFCEKNQISHCFSREKKVAGKDWILHFLQRHDDVRHLISQTKP